MADDQTVEQDNRIERERQLQRRRERSRAFLEVFGPVGHHTKHGQMILDALHASFGKGLPKNILDDNGRTDMWQTARCLGHFDVLETIYETLKWKENDVNPSGTGTS